MWQYPLAIDKQMYSKENFAKSKKYNDEPFTFFSEVQYFGVGVVVCSQWAKNISLHLKLLSEYESITQGFVVVGSQWAEKMSLYWNILRHIA